MLHRCLEAPPETERVWGGLCINDIICRREPDGISMAQNELRIKEHKQIIAEMLPPGAIQDYETLYLLDKSTMYKLMNLLENTNSRKWLIYCIKIINRLK